MQLRLHRAVLLVGRAAHWHVQRLDSVCIIRVCIYHLKRRGASVYNGRVRCAFIREAATLRPG